MKAVLRDPLLEYGVRAAVRAGLFRNEKEALREAVNTWFAVKPNLRLEVAIELFREREVTLDRAAEIGGLNRWTFHDLLRQRGIKVEIQAEPASALAAAAAAIRKRAR